MHWYGCAILRNRIGKNFIGLKDSIHSKDKLKKKYPDVNVTAIQTLYGLNVSPMAQDCNNRSISENIIDTATNSGLVCRIRIFSLSVPFRTWSLVRKSILGYSDKNIWEYREALPFMYKLARQLRLRFYAWIVKSIINIHKWLYIANIDLAIYRSVREVVQDSTSTRFDLVAKIKTQYSEKEYLELNNIDLRELYRLTRSPYWVTHCQLQSIDCRFSWKLVYTFLGACLMLDSQDKLSE